MLGENQIKVELNNGRVTEIDPEDAVWMFTKEDGKSPWYISPSGSQLTLRVRRLDEPTNNTEYFSRVLWEHWNGPIAAGMLIDHIDRQALNNKKENLRLTNRQGNAFNSRSKLRRFKGVYSWKSGRWRAAYRQDNKFHTIGCFNDEGEAAIAYDIHMLELRKDFAVLNFEEKRKEYEKIIREKRK